MWLLALEYEFFEYENVETMTESIDPGLLVLKNDEMLFHLFNVLITHSKHISFESPPNISFTGKESKEKTMMKLLLLQMTNKTWKDCPTMINGIKRIIPYF